MASGIRIPFISDVSDFLRGTKDIEKTLEQVEDSLDDVAAGGEQATDRLAADLRDLADDADRSFNEIRRSAGTSFDAMRRDAGTSSDAMRRDFREDVDGMGGELGEEAREGAASFDGSMDSIADSAQAVAANVLSVLGPVGLALGAVGAAALGVFRAEAERMKEATRNLTASMIENFGDAGAAVEAINDRLRELAENGELVEHAKVAEDLAHGLDDATGFVEDYMLAAAGDPEAIKRTTAALAELSASREDVGKYDLSSLERGQRMIEGQTGAYERAEQATARYLSVQKDGERPTRELTEAVEEQTTEVLSLGDALDRAANKTLGLRGAQRDYQAALDDAQESLEEHGKTMDVTTEAGRANATALDQVATAAAGEAAALNESGASQDEVNKRLQQGRDDLVKIATQFGMTQTDAEAFAGSVLSIPTDVIVAVGFDQAAMTTALANGKTLSDMVKGIKVDADDAAAAYDALRTSISNALAAGTASPQQARAETAGLGRYSNRVK